MLTPDSINNRRESSFPKQRGKLVQRDDGALCPGGTGRHLIHVKRYSKRSFFSSGLQRFLPGASPLAAGSALATGGAFRRRLACRRRFGRSL